MSILKYVKQQRDRPRIDSRLRDQVGLTPAQARFINDEIANTTPSRKQSLKRHGNRYDFKERIKIANYSRFYSPYKAAQKYKISQNTARKYMDILNKYLGQNRHVNVSDVKPRDISELRPNKGGRPAYLTKKLRQKAKDAIKGMRSSGIPVNNNIVAATLSGIMRSVDPRLLARNGGHIRPHVYARSFRIHQLGAFSFRRQTAKRRPSLVKSFEINRWRCLNHFIIDRYRIPRALQFNKDESFCKFVNVGSETLELRGSQHVRVVGVDDKRGLSQSMTCSGNGKLLPLQMVYGGMILYVHLRKNANINVFI